MENNVLNQELIIVLVWMVVGKWLTVGIFTAIEKFYTSRDSDRSDIVISNAQTMHELQSWWFVFIDPVFVALLVKFGLLKFAPESLISVLITVVVFFVWVEIWFYFTHRLMHDVPWLWKIHKHHHQSKATQALTANSISVIEKFVLYTLGCFGFLALVSHFIPISLLGIVAFYTYYEFITGPIAHSKFTNNTDHILHHVKYNINLGFTTSVFDKLFGTYEQSNTRELNALKN